ncbi:hypothetical protein AB205_0194270 [Aquarana catesbeiana]|uniref:Uncharacterized protein n=1 Tax=Aquarana catesbeiana TaxID=8400 RepID=A0A2G9S4U1_AQUCT|nr:hypothetical protein AB205_0194270 [Aquarana catesbeiana]
MQNLFEERLKPRTREQNVGKHLPVQKILSMCMSVWPTKAGRSASFCWMCMLGNPAADRLRSALSATGRER